MFFCFKSSHLASSMSVMSLAAGLVFSPLTTQKTLAQTAINGAGSTFIAPLVGGTGGWFNVYGRAVSPASNPPGPVNSSVRIPYVGVGSGCGVAAFLSQKQPANPPCPSSPAIPLPIAFAATDAPLTSSQQTVTGSPNAGPPVQVPVVAGSVALPYNSSLNVSGGLKLSRTTYCGIFTGNIKTLNGKTITVVVRADSSGTTFSLTNHLNTACNSTQYKWTRGVGTTVSWPTGFKQVTGGSAVASTVKSTANAIGYVDAAAARSAGLSTAALQNKAGNYVSPTPSATSAALPNSSDTSASRVITINVPDPTASSAYPIIAVTYLVFYDRYSSSSVAAGIRGFITWALPTTTTLSCPSGGQGSTTNADVIAVCRTYAPLPANLKTKVRNSVNTYVDTSAGR
jgi:phosphate transport system substrate-binding protein